MLRLGPREWPLVPLYTCVWLVWQSPTWLDLSHTIINKKSKILENLLVLEEKNNHFWIYCSIRAGKWATPPRWWLFYYNGMPCFILYWRKMSLSLWLPVSVFCFKRFKSHLQNLQKCLTDTHQKHSWCPVGPEELDGHVWKHTADPRDHVIHVSVEEGHKGSSYSHPCL